jgi:uncharacterized protein (DUF1697 family)
MPRYVAFLRGINVTGSRMNAAALCEPFTDLGFEDVTSFRASGNVIFSAGREPVAKLEKRIEDEFRERLGLNAVTFIRSQAQMRALADAEPFPPRTVQDSTGKLQVTFLTKTPSAAARKEVLALATENDLLAFAGRELFWLPAQGFQGTGLDWKAIAKLVGPTTHRTKGTVDQIYGKYLAQAAAGR